MNFAALQERFGKYTDSFRDPAGVLPDAMQLKYAHTLDVLRIAERIAEQEKFSEHETFLVRAGALFHDTARYEEIKRFHTFDDRKAGMDHGHAGVRIIVEQNFLDGMEPMDQLVVLSAVELHNKATVDYKALGPLFVLCAKVTRDADKLSILEIMLRILTGKLRIKDESIVKLERSDKKGFSPAILEAALNGGTPYHKDMQSLDDFILTLFCWSADLHFAASADFILENDLYPQLRKTLPQEPVVDEILKRTLERLKCLSSK